MKWARWWKISAKLWRRRYMRNIFELSIAWNEVGQLAAELSRLSNELDGERLHNRGSVEVEKIECATCGLMVEAENGEIKV